MTAQFGGSVVQSPSGAVLYSLSEIFIGGDFCFVNCDAKIVSYYYGRATRQLVLSYQVGDVITGLPLSSLQCCTGFKGLVVLNFIYSLAMSLKNAPPLTEWSLFFFFLPSCESSTPS